MTTNTSNAGTYDITYNSGLVNSLGYIIIDALGSNGEYTINRVNLTVTVDNASKLYGDIDPVFTYQITSGSLVGADTLSGVLSRNLGEEVGTYLIDASGLLNPNYLITKHNGVFSILTRDTNPNFSENLISNLLKNIEPVHLNDVIVHNSEDQIIARLLESSIKNQLDTLPNELNEITQTFSPTSVSENLTHQTLENSPSSVNSFAIVSTPQGLPNNVQTSLDSIDQKSNLAVSKTIQTSNDKQTSSIETKSASNDIVQNLSNDDITKSIQTVENAMQEKGFTTVESQMITNALLEVSLNNPANANNVANNVANAIALDKASKAASLSDGTFENTNSLFDTTFQNLLKKGVAPKDAYAQASLLIKVTLPKEVSLADTFSSISKAEGEMLLNLMGKGYSQEEAYKQVKLIHFPKESQKTEIINGKITDEYKYIDKFLVHNSLEQAIELSKKISMLEKHYRQIDNNSINSFYADRNLKKPVSNSLEFEKILLHELKHSNFSDAYRNAISKIKTIPLNQVTPLEQMAQAKIAKKGTNGEKIWWVEFTKQILNGKNQNEAIQSANRIQKLCEARTKQSQIVENKYLKGVSK